MSLGARISGRCLRHRTGSSGWAPSSHAGHHVNRVIIAQRPCQIRRRTAPFLCHRRRRRDSRNSRSWNRTQFRGKVWPRAAKSGARVQAGIEVRQLCRTEAGNRGGSQRLDAFLARVKTIPPVNRQQLVTAISGQSHGSLTCAPIASGEAGQRGTVAERLVKDAGRSSDKVELMPCMRAMTWRSRN